MVRRLGRMAVIPWEVLCTRGVSGRAKAHNRGNDPWSEEVWPDENPKVSLAGRLERDHRVPCRVAHWLLIKGWMAVLLMAGLMTSGLIAGFLGGH